MSVGTDTSWCACGCRTPIESTNRPGRPPRRFVSGHNLKVLLRPAAEDPETPCPKCGGIDFVFRGSAKKRACRTCTNAYARQYQARHREELHARRREQDPHCSRRSKLKLLYGLTIEDYDERLRAQKGVCAICHKPETRRLRSKLAPLVVDHDHKTGEIRGLLCHRCNTRLGSVEDRAWLADAQAYLFGVP